MPMYIFYDLETTGTDIVYDQILQFGAILADDKLVELDRFEMRCRLLPWIVPSPGALVVTATDVGRLDDDSLPDFYAMMHKISERLARWGRATFIGYNSMRFDEPFLQRAFWQALFPPYLTVTGGNTRLDLLALIRAAAWFRPELFDIPRRADGAPSFRLDALAPANGFNAHRAHDAMGDVEATLFLARKVVTRFPELWKPLVARASKASSAALLESGAPVFLFQHGSMPPVACYRRIDTGGSRQSHAILARLDYDWAGAGMPAPENSTAMRSALRRIPLNKAPLLLTLAEAEAIAGLTPSESEYEQGAFLTGDADYCARLAELIEPFARPETADGAEVEETIFDGFASLDDERLMREFHGAPLHDQLTIARKFRDPRFRRLAMRSLFVRSPEVMSAAEQERIQRGIARRLDGDAHGEHAWRSIPDAIQELSSDPELAMNPEARRIMGWLTLRSRLSNFVEK